MLNKNWKKTSTKKKKQQQQQKTKKQVNQRNRTKQKPNGKNKKSYDKINQTQSHVRIYTYKHVTKRIAITEIKYLLAFHKYIFKCR